MASLVLALAALSGFQDALRSEILARTPQIEIELPVGSEAATVAASIRGLEGVESVQELVRGQGWLLFGSRVEGVDVVGYEGTLPDFFPAATDRQSGLYLPERLAASWAVGPGDLLQVVSPRPVLAPFGPPLPRLRTLPLRGVYSTGRTEMRPRVALPLATARELLGKGDRRLAVAAADREEALRLADRLSSLLPAGSRVRSYRELNRPLFFALRLEKALMFVAVSLIVVVAGLALVADLALIIANKRPDIGMLEAMGATPSDLRRAFLLLGGLLSGLGAGTGAAAGLLGAWTLDHFRLLSLPGEVYFLDYVPFRVLPSDLGATLGVTVLLAVGSSWWAARRAASLSPVEALRR